MGFRNGCKAKVWEVKPGKGNYTDVRLSVSEKDNRTDDWFQAFQGWVRFIGKANETVPSEGDFITLESVDITNFYDKEKKITYWNAKCFAWTPHGDRFKDIKTFDVSIPEDEDEETPFR